jgi:hypothetical protein
VHRSGSMTGFVLGQQNENSIALRARRCIDSQGPRRCSAGVVTGDMQAAPETQNGPYAVEAMSRKSLTKFA